MHKRIIFISADIRNSKHYEEHIEVEEQTKVTYVHTHST